MNDKTFPGLFSCHIFILLTVYGRFVVALKFGGHCVANWPI